MKNTEKQQPLLELKNVKFSYIDEPKPLLNIKELVLNHGDKVGIIGDNGSGKSTIVKIILGLKTPTGTVNLFGSKALWGNHYSQLGYIGDPSLSPGYTGLPTGISVREMLNTFEKICNIEEKDFADFKEALDFESYLDNDIKFLSNGQRKRLMIYLALAKRPKFIIADEATDGLDKSRQFVIEEIEKIYQEYKPSILWISHQHDEVARLTDTIYELSDGELNSVTKNRFSCNVSTDPKTYLCGSHHNLTPKGWLELTARIYTNPDISSFEIKGERTEGEDK